ncbi:MAG: hypothetical protein AMXMBFR58_15330 [Phycisphaerae bacterium]|nr:hypothetical protein [Phycisphaerales bacterium]MCK6477085.1 hypothetical protein [Phycisphaerales bacterium]
MRFTRPPLVLLAIGMLVLSTGGWTWWRAATAPSRAINAALDEYKAAIDSSDAHRAAEFMGRESRDWASSMVRAALTDTRHVLRARPLSDQMHILELRQRYTQHELEAMDDHQAVAIYAAMLAGSEGGEPSPDLEAIDIQILGERAVCSLAADVGGESGIAMSGTVFTRESGTWRFNPHTMALENIPFIAQFAKDQLQIEQLVQDAWVESFGKPLDPKLWDGPRK